MQRRVACRNSNDLHRELGKQLGSLTLSLWDVEGLPGGMGLQQVDPGSEPVKREGDGKAPAGLFKLSKVFGYEDSPNPKISMPYITAGSTTECIDDPQSSYYNRIIDIRQSPLRDWKSSERMRRKDELYRWGVVVDHNSNNPVKSFGSCVFLHVWRSASSPTVGCTALAPATMKRLVYWLDDGLEPVLLQLPRPVFERLGKAWALPTFVPN